MRPCARAITSRPASAAGWPPRRATSGCAAPWSSRRAAAPTKDSYLARLRGPDKAAVAVAHSLLDVIGHLLTTGEVFTDLDADYFTSRQDKEDQAAA